MVLRILIAVLFLCSGVFFGPEGNAYQANIIQPSSKKFAPDRYKPKPYEQYQGQKQINAMVEMYSQTFCGPCKVKRKQLKAANIFFHEYFIDKDAQKNAEMYRLLEENNMPKSYYGTPMIVVNGEIMGNPTINQIKRKLKR